MFCILIIYFILYGVYYSRLLFLLFHCVRKLLILNMCGKALYVALCLLLAKPNQSTTGGSEQQRETAED